MIGLEAVTAQLLSLDAEVAQKTLAKAARKAFARVLEAAKAMVPVDSGDLRDSLQLSVSKPRKGDGVVIVGLKIRNRAAKRSGGRWKGKLPPSRRWHFIELGTIHSSPHPFARPALDSEAQQVIDDLRVQLNAAIEAAVRKNSRGK